MAASWKPGDAVLPETGLEVVLHTIGCGQNDFDSFAKIADKLKTRNVTMAGDLFGNDASWSREELLGCLKNLELKKSTLAYVVALETFVGRAVGAAPALQLKTTAVKSTAGGNMSDRCTKKEPSRSFNPRKWRPDGRVFDGLHRLREVEFLPSAQEKLYLDRLWISAMIYGEASLGDYLPDGMAGHLGRLHDDLLPPFKPKHFGKANQEPREAAEVIRLRFMNGRFQAYPRIVLDQQYRHLFDTKAQNALRSSFVDGLDERLATSERNKFLTTIIEVYSNQAPVSRLNLNLASSPHQPPHSPCTPARSQEHAVVFPGDEVGEGDKAAAPRAEPKAAAAPARSTATVTPVVVPAVPVADDDLDGLGFGPTGVAALPDAPPPKPAAAAPPQPAVSKKAAQKSKRAGGLGKRPAERPVKDSSDEDDSDADSDASEGEGAPAAAPAAAPAPARQPAKQTPRAAAPARSTPKSAPGSQIPNPNPNPIVLALTRACAPRSFQPGRQAALHADQAPVQDPDRPGAGGRGAAHRPCRRAAPGQDQRGVALRARAAGSLAERQQVRLGGQGQEHQPAQACNLQAPVSRRHCLLCARGGPRLQACGLRVCVWV